MKNMKSIRLFFMRFMNFMVNALERTCDEQRASQEAGPSEPSRHGGTGEPNGGPQPWTALRHVRK